MIVNYWKIGGLLGWWSNNLFGKLFPRILNINDVLCCNETIVSYACSNCDLIDIHVSDVVETCWKIPLMAGRTTQEEVIQQN